jgi:hypothetical protein
VHLLTKEKKKQKKSFFCRQKINFSFFSLSLVAPSTLLRTAAPAAGASQNCASSGTGAQSAAAEAAAADATSRSNERAIIPEPKRGTIREGNRRSETHLSTLFFFFFFWSFQKTVGKL